jgi:hypothetical protein
MWAPGLLQGRRQRTTAPAPNIGIEKYFFEAGEKILARIKEHRNTVILPERTGPIADVLYSAAGNSADDPVVPQGHRQLLVRDRRGPLHHQPTTGAVSQIITGFPAVLLRRRNRRPDGHLQRQPDQRGRDQAMEFASGNFGMVESAYDYAMDTTPPSVSIEYSAAQTSGDRSTSASTGTTRRRSSTTRPTARRRRCRRRTYNNQRARSIGEVLTLSTPAPTRQVDGGRHEGQPVAVRASACWSRPTTNGTVGGPCRRRSR